MKNLLIFLFLFCGLVVFSQTSAPQKNTGLFDSQCMNNATVSLCVVDAGSGKEIINIGQCVTPASVVKLITSATALEILGADYRFETKVWYNGTITGHTLYGDVVITGGGDPTLGSSYFNNGEPSTAFLTEWATALRKLNIDTITGNIISDPSVYTDQEVPQTWIWEDMGNYYGASAQGISVFDNSFSIFFNTGNKAGDTCTVQSVVPEVPELKIENKVIASEQGGNNAYVFGSPYDSYRVIRGTLPKGNTAFKVKASVPDPALLLASEFEKTLKKNEVVIMGSAKNTHIAAPDSILKEHQVVAWQSPSLDQIILQMNQNSINLYAEQLCKQLGLMVKNEGSTAAGAQAITEFWEQKGIKNIYLVDGSGLSRTDAITARSLADVLLYMKKNSTYYNSYLQSIPVTGMEGTQRYYFQNSVLTGKAHAKTGSMTRVRSMAGYMVTQKGTNIVFAVMVNNFSGPSSEAVAQIEKLLERIYLED
jgi:serine-type D-Ala-D-Ala carboxypeptidase/endopeptidase (penicillin-binding protein 4)